MPICYLDGMSTQTAFRHCGSAPLLMRLLAWAMRRR